VMAADLASSAHTGLDVQLCGDAHVLNFGLWASPERQLSFDLRDFDETLRGPFEWDVKRYLASLVVLARDNGLTEARALQAVRAGVRSYRNRLAAYALAGELDIWYQMITSAELLDLFEPEERELAAARLERAQKTLLLVEPHKLLELASGIRLDALGLRLDERSVHLPFGEHLGVARPCQGQPPGDDRGHAGHGERARRGARAGEALRDASGGDDAVVDV
jgi:Uncharacterized protein conserved in bacteria (DUF2252)